MYIKVIKDLNNIKTKVIGMFTLRQILAFAIAMAIASIVYNTFLVIEKEIAMSIATICALLVLWIGIKNIDGQDFEIYILNFLRLRVLSPTYRIYKSRNLYDYLKEMSKNDTKKTKSYNKKTSKNIKC